MDDRKLEPLPIEWIDTSSGGQGGEAESGSPNIFDAGSGGDSAHSGGSGAVGGSAQGGSTGGSSAAGSGAGPSGGTSGSLGMAGDDGTNAGSGGELPPGCKDLDSDGEPDCQETLVENGSFDQNVAGWVADDSVNQGWTQTDAGDQLASGSLSLTNVTSEDVNGYTMSGTQQCIPIDATGAYHFVSQIYLGDNQGEGSGGVNLWFFNLPNCQGSILSATTKLDGDTGSWQLVYANPPTPMDARSVAVRLVVAKPYRNPKFTVSFDNILFVKD